MMKRLLAAGCLLSCTLVSSCSSRATVVPRGIASRLTSPATIEEIIQSADPEATVLGGRSGGGGGGGSSSFAGTNIHASYTYMYKGRVKSEKKLGAILDVLRSELRAEITRAGGEIHGQGGGPTTGQWAPGEPMRTLRTAESIRYQRLGFQGDLFLVAYPVSEPKANYIVLVRVVETLVGK